MRKVLVFFLNSGSRFLGRNTKRLAIILPSALFGVILAQVITSSWAVQNGSTGAHWTQVQPGLFSFLSQGETNPPARAKNVRERSEAALEERFEAHQKGLWQAGLSGVKEDHLQKIRQSIREASEPEGFGPFARSISDGYAVQQFPVAAADEPVDNFRPLQLGVPVGPLFGTLAGQAFPITLVSTGDEEGGDEEGEIPEDPTNPEPPEPPVVVDPPQPPVGEVPIPGAFLLFPAGLALLARRKKRLAA